MNNDNIKTSREEFCNDVDLLKKYNEVVLTKYNKLEDCIIACVVSHDYLFELFVFYASIRKSWSLFPWKIIAFSTDIATVDKVNLLDLPGLEARQLIAPSTDSSWGSTAALKVSLIEHSGLDRAIVSDLDNLFLRETPELFLLASDYDVAFIGAPHSEWIIQTSLWSFRRTDASVRFANLWAQESLDRLYSDASGLPFALSKNVDENLSVCVLAKSKIDGAAHHLCPYDIQVNIRPLHLKSDALGVFEKHMGRAKVVHFAGLRAVGSESVVARMQTLAADFPESSIIFPYYLECANEAARILGLAVVEDEPGLLDSLSKKKAKSKKKRWFMKVFCRS